MLRAQVGLVDIADLLFLASEEYEARLAEAGESLEGKGPFLFGRKEGRIALGNRRKEPLFLFGAHAATPWLSGGAPTETQGREPRCDSPVDAASGTVGDASQVDGGGTSCLPGHHEVLQQARGPAASRS